MSDRLKQLKPTELIRALEKLGFVVRHQTGSHCILRHPATKCMASVPIHAGDLKRGLLFGVIKQAGLTKENIQEAL